MNTALPLNGCDLFMLAMDLDMRERGSPGNICHLLVRLAEGTDLEQLSKSIRSHPAFIQVSLLRLTRSPLRVPRWTQGSKATPTPSALAIQNTEELERWILSHSLDVRREAPFGFVSLPSMEAGPVLLFYWHHSLCDAHGGEALVSLVSGASADVPPSIIPSQAARPPLRETIKAARSVKKHIFSRAQTPLARLAPTGGSASRQAYCKIRFSSAETATIDALSREITGGMFPTALYLAATARACDELFSNDPARPPFLVPVPHDIRRQTRQSSPLTNQVSFAFFRLERSAMKGLREYTNEVIEQLQETIAHRFQLSMLEFLRLIKRLPLALFWKVIERPSKGHPASFYFSDIGGSLSGLTSIHGAPVTYATHYPPVLAPPGFTTVWSRYRGDLEVTVCYDQAVVDAAALSGFETHLRDQLLRGAP